jgi:hypothetical protein
MAENEKIPIATISYGDDEIATLNAGKYISLHTADQRLSQDVKIAVTAKDYDGSVDVEGEPNEPIEGGSNVIDLTNIPEVDSIDNPTATSPTVVRYDDAIYLLVKEE